MEIDVCGCFLPKIELNHLNSVIFIQKKDLALHLGALWYQSGTHPIISDLSKLYLHVISCIFDLRLQQAYFLFMLAFSKFGWFPVSLDAESHLQIAFLCYYEGKMNSLYAHKFLYPDTHRHTLHFTHVWLSDLSVWERDRHGTVYYIQLEFLSVNFPFHHLISCGPIGGSTY